MSYEGDAFQRRACPKCGRIVIEKIELKKCVQCGCAFVPTRPTQVCCGPVCAQLRQKQQKELRRARFKSSDG